MIASFIDELDIASDKFYEALNQVLGKPRPQNDYRKRNHIQYLW
jgi:hypothetical protein